MAKKLSEKQRIDLLVDYILENSDSMPSTNLYEKCILKTEEIAELVLKEIKEKLRDKK